MSSAPGRHILCALLAATATLAAFVGLGAPYWDPDCRGAVFGLTRNSGPNELAKAALGVPASAAPLGAD